MATVEDLVVSSSEQFPVAFVSELARSESYNRHLYRPNSYLHKWWARRCGTTFRAILKQLVAEPGLRDFYAAGGLEGTTILDPMMGGGTTLHEAIRMGANVVGVDIDPIPVLQARATLDASVTLEQLERDFELLLEGVREDLGGLFDTSCRACSATVPFQHVLHAQRASCDCGDVLRVDSTDIRHEPAGTISLCVRCGEVSHEVGSGRHVCAARASPPRFVPRKVRICTDCAADYRPCLDLPLHERFVPFCVVYTCPDHGLTYATPSANDRELARKAELRRPQLSDDDSLIAGGPKSGALTRAGVRHYEELFSSRQLMVWQSFSQQLQQASDGARLTLALLGSTALELNSLLCGYKGGNARRPGAIRHVFAHHAYSIPSTALENNPLLASNGSGTLQSLFDRRVRKARLWARSPVERVVEGRKARSMISLEEVDLGTEIDDPSLLREGTRRFLLHQGSSTELPLSDDSIDHVVTDPPYFDSVQYGDLAAFFRVWLRRFAPDAATWDYDLLDSAVDLYESDGERYASVLGDVFAECRRVLRPGGTMAFTFHHWRPDAWAALTCALQRGGFELVDFAIVHSENPMSVHVNGLEALTDDAVLWLRPVGDATRAWARPRVVQKSESHEFCRGCAQALGWMLGSGLDSKQVATEWAALLGG